MDRTWTTHENNQRKAAKRQRRSGDIELLNSKTSGVGQAKRRGYLSEFTDGGEEVQLLLDILG